MIVRFATYEEAGIYAAWMRSEGHYSAILDEHMGFIYGPLAIGGFRVIVSDEPVEDVEPPPATPPMLDSTLDAARVVVLAFITFGVLGWLILAVKYPDRYVVDAVAWAIRCGLMLAVLGCLAPLMIPMTRALRDERSLFGGCIRGLVILHVAAQWLGMLAALGYAIWNPTPPHWP